MERKIVTADFFPPSLSQQRTRHWVEFLKMLNESTSLLINQRNHWRVECLMRNEVTHLIHLMSLYWNEWGLATEVNFV